MYLLTRWVHTAPGEKCEMVAWHWKTVEDLFMPVEGWTITPPTDDHPKWVKRLEKDMGLALMMLHWDVGMSCFHKEDSLMVALSGKCSE